MILICINKGKIKSLTEGKRYKSIREASGIHSNSKKSYSGFWIINDSGKEKYYSSKRFLNIEEHRDKVLNNLFI